VAARSHSGDKFNGPPEPSNPAGEKMKFTLSHNYDELGGKYASPMEDGRYTSFEEAAQAAHTLWKKGQCPQIKREDEAILAPGGPGCWLAREDLQEIPLSLEEREIIEKLGW